MNFLSETQLSFDDYAKLCNEAVGSSSGAVVGFLGIIRQSDFNHQISYLEYSAQKNLAQKSIADILSRANRQYELIFSHALHRIGVVYPQQIAVIVVCSAQHRKQAYLANQFIIDEIKAHTPIWKQECLLDGQKIWSEGIV